MIKPSAPNLLIGIGGSILFGVWQQSWIAGFFIFSVFALLSEAKEKKEDNE